MSKRSVMLALGVFLCGCPGLQRRAETCMDYQGKPYDESEASRWSALDWARMGDFETWDNGNLCAGQAYYRGALVLEPNNNYALVGLGNAYLLEARRVLFKKTRRDGRPDPDEGSRRAASKLLERATQRANQVLERDPTYGSALLLLAASYEAQDKFEQAYQYIDKVERGKVIPEKQISAFYAWKGYLLKQLGRSEEADAALKKAYAIDDDPRRSLYADRLLNPQDYENR